jgi:uroporphyrinogen-III synthase
MKNIFLLSPSEFAGAIYFPTIEIIFFNKIIDFSDIDTILFTSKNAVDATNKINQEWKKIPVIAIGKKTAERVEELNGTVLYFSEIAYSENITSEIINNFSHRKFLYLRPEKIISTLTEDLKKQNIFIKEEIIYRTDCKKNNNINFGEKPIFIATSPSTVKCLIKNNKIPDNSIFIAIGKKTAQVIPKQFYVVVSEKQTVENCFKLAKKFKK